MNERLEQEWKSYCDKQGTGTMISVNVKDVAQHFYNLALEDVRKEVLEWYNKRTTPRCVAEGDIVAPMREGYKRVLDFISNLTK